jgi:predicted enzyme related to lactoylglutathione lyase
VKGEQVMKIARDVVKSVVAMVQVESVERAAEFYGHLGFVIGNTFAPPGAESLSWAWLETPAAQIMVARAAEPVIPDQQGVLFYLYVDDVAAMREKLLAAGLAPGLIEERFYAPQGEFRLIDPDGYCLMITHV